ncbi:MAG: flagellar basal-body MS-ring/collar protein FliF, partial [Acetobacteraceae bacterium]
MSALIESFKALGLGRLISMAGVAGAMLLMLAFLALRGGGGDRMALLYSDLDLRDASQVVDQLDKAHIAHDVQGDGSRIMVPSADVPRARLLLAKEGLPSGGSIGYEIFDRGDEMTASQFQQTISQTRAMEGELVRSILMISGVKAARVHLVLAKREPFARDRQEAQASVVLTMAGAARMDHEGVQAVLNLVAAATPGLRPQNISIIDSHGDLLARPGDVSGADAAAQTAAELRRTTEQRLSRAVEDMLARTLGQGRVRAETSVEMDFDQVHETKEHYDPDGKVERSTQNTTDNTRSTDLAATVSVANNLPNADAGASPAGSQELRSEETTNYEIDKTVRTIVHEQPQVRRISVAVLVDQVPVTDATGAVTWHDRSADELARIAALTRSAVGYDEKRGDKVEVVSMRFVAADDGADKVSTPTVFGVPVSKADLMKMGQSGLIGVVAVLALLLVLRPMAMRLTQLPAALEDAQMAPVELSLAGPAGAARTGAGAALAAPGGVPLLEDDSMITIGSIEGSVRASSIRRVSEMVDKHPDESLAIMRGWMLREPT